jgi:hypothetical protein
MASAVAAAAKNFAGPTGEGCTVRRVSSLMALKMPVVTLPVRFFKMGIVLNIHNCDKIFHLH